jgi:hypothetical protein
MAPSGRRATTSVKVPPRSIQNCQAGLFTVLIAQDRWFFYEPRWDDNKAIEEAR